MVVPGARRCSFIRFNCDPVSMSSVTDVLGFILAFTTLGMDSLGDKEKKVVLRAIDGKERNESRLIIPSEINNPDILSERDDDDERNYSDVDSGRDMQLIFLKGMITMVDKLDKLRSFVSSSRDSQSDEKRDETPNTPLTHAETGTSREEHITGISRAKLIELIEEVVRRTLGFVIFYALFIMCFFIIISYLLCFLLFY
ncbi:hypothetical protein M0802_016354 [Mischocyttarus mexicanus]|nr:hypothetical protein M0802_016354 [Mischocyttarus mexicanus]